MNEEAAPARRLTRAAQRKLNELIAQGVPLASAMMQVRAEPGAFEPIAPAETPAPIPRPAWSGDRTDWERAVEKLQILRELDRGYTTFGARTHRYLLRPTATTRQLAAIEKKLGAKLPPGLHAFYLDVGDGGAGPDFGLFAAAELKGRRPATAYPGIEALRALGVRTEAQPPEPTSANLSPSRLTGIVTLLFSGCSLYSGVVCTGDVGRIVHWDDDRIVETDDTLVAWYERWLDDEIAQFRLVERLRDEGATSDALVSAMKRLLPPGMSPAAKSSRARELVDAKLRGLSPEEADEATAGDGEVQR
ncbi:SMI1/KNR4 family protein [Nannocystis bainbridge]|uniref:SMI1/KNR4 family protein n=1 Tax=Nannocystis bainbridge TaxID=2995303 RepID=A0ABT5DU62_9BACT|nr:SMI1/KNR4 family protein [Nannocystis bainbridge]MDC0716653.1 SMI1/KNR4 family protein [Nannocystis bainbridge]